MQTLLNTLYVMTPNAYAHLENATVRIDVEREKRLQVPLHHLSSVVCLLPLLQARFIARTLRGEMESYLPFVVR